MLKKGQTQKKTRTLLSPELVPMNYFGLGGLGGVQGSSDVPSIWGVAKGFSISWIAKLQGGRSAE